MKQVGTKKQVIKKKAFKTKSGETLSSLLEKDPSLHKSVNRSDGAHKSKWTKHIKQYAKSNNISYSQALADPKCKQAYHSKPAPNAVPPPPRK